MPDIVIDKAGFSEVLREVIGAIYSFANSIVIDFCGVTFDLWDVFMAGLILALIGLVWWAIAE